jgi:hypothetical protein
LPRDGSDSPIVVYCLELPVGFPAVEPAGPSGRGVPLDEDVTVTGYFFKRWLHRCEGGMNLSPLVLGTITDWEPHATSGGLGAGAHLPPWLLLSATLAMAVLATLIAVCAYRSSSWSRSEVAHSASVPDSLPAFNTSDVHGTISQALGELELTNGHEGVPGRETARDGPATPGRDSRQ